MKRINSIIILLFIISSPTLFGQKTTDANIFGDVQCNGVHVPFINVFVKGTSIGTTTDATGHFNLVNLPVGPIKLRVQGIGYKSVEKEIEVISGLSIEVKFKVEEDIFLMEQVVVSSDKNEINRKEAPVIVNVISPRTFEQRQSNSLIDGLDFTCGVRTECNCQNCGFTQVRMNGLDGPYSQVLINSRPVFSGLAGVYGLELLPSNMIQRVEIVRGGGSALFGGNAIAGTVNVITREPVSNTFQLGSDFSAIGVGHHDGGDLAYDRSVKFNGSLVTDDNKSGLFLYGMTRNRNPFDENNDGFTEMVKLKNNSVGFNSYYKPGKLSKISLDFYKLNEYRRGGSELDLLPHEAEITEEINHDITGVGLNYESFTPDGNKIAVYGATQYIDRDAYYGALQDPTAYGKTYDLTYNMGFQYTKNFDNLFFSPSTVTVGADNTTGTLEDVKLGSGGLANTVIANQLTNTSGLFLQNEWKSEKSKFLVGFRFDHYSVSDRLYEGEEDVTGNVFIPRITFLHDFSDDLQYRLSYAKGYRAPQIFDEDLHIETSGARRITHSNAPDLRQETSHSFSTSLNYSKAVGNILYEVLVEGFYTILQDPFANDYSPIDSLGNVEYVRINAEDDATVSGVNTELNIGTMSGLMMQLGFTFQKSQYENPQPWGDIETNTTKSFLRAPDQYGYLTFHSHLSKKLELSVTGTYTGPMLVPHFGRTITTQEELNDLLNGGFTEDYESALAINDAINNRDIIEGEKLIKSEKFFDMGVKLHYDIEVSREFSVELSAGIQNIFNSTQHNHDKGVYRDPGFIYGPCQPRTVYVGIKIGNLL